MAPRGSTPAPARSTRVRLTVALVAALAATASAATAAVVVTAPTKTQPASTQPAHTLQAPPQPAPVRAVVAPPERPHVAVRGDRLVDGRGHPLQLRGVTRSGFEYACVQDRPIADGPVDDQAISAMTAWGVTSVRLTLNGPCWLGDDLVPVRRRGAVYRTAVVDVVERLQRHGLVVVLSLQWDAAGPGARHTGQLPMPDATRGPAFWSSVATTFRSQRGVAFELHSEPYGVDWTCWRNGCAVPPTAVPGKRPTPAYRAAGMQQLVDAVRRSGARNPLLLSGLEWGNDLTGWSAALPVDPARALVASLHVYDRTRCRGEQCWDAARLATAGHPLVASELGDHTCTGALAVRFARWADPQDVSYLAWTWNPWDCTSGPALLQDWSGRPTPYGAAWRAHLLRRAAAAA